MFAPILAVSHQNQHQNQSLIRINFKSTSAVLQAQKTSSNNSESDSDTNATGMIEPPRQKLTATNSNLTISESENEHTDNSETLKQKYHIKKIVSNAEDLSLSLPSQLSTLPKGTSNVNKLPKKDIIVCLKYYYILFIATRMHQVTRDLVQTLRTMLNNGKKLSQIMMIK